MTESNFRTYLSDTHALAFDRNRGILIVQTPNPLTAEMLGRHWRPTIRGVIHRLRLQLQGVPRQDVPFQSRR